jgi:putative MATE family efflux protein
VDARTTVLLDGALIPTLLRLAVPNVLVQVVQVSVGLIEAYFVAKLGIDALAGIAFVFPVLALVQMVSGGAMGGGILTAIARALGSNRREMANALVWHAVAIAIVLGLLTTIAVLAGGPALYHAMGGRDGSLIAATTYSGVIFAAAVPIWLFNSLAAVIRGTGNLFVPAAVVTTGALVLIPLSPALIFGWGIFPHLGIAGGAVAVATYYCVGSGVFAWLLWSNSTVLRPAPKPPMLEWPLAREILRVGLASSMVSLSTNVTIATATGLVGVYGPKAVAGFGTGVRVEYLLVPLIFGLGAPIGAIVATSIGAKSYGRAVRAAWTGALLAGIISEAIGITAAVNPTAWLSLFSTDALANEVGAQYLHLVGPFYGFFGVGLALYFASQGVGRLQWPLTAAGLRVFIALVGGWVSLRAGGGLTGLFVVLSGALICFALVNAAAVWSGAWFARSKLPART